MAKAGLSFSSPLYGGTDTDVSNLATAEFLGNPAANTGLGGLGGSSLANMAALTEGVVRSSQFELPKMKQPPAIAFSPSKNSLYVNGMEFAADDATQALQSESWMNLPSQGLPQGGDWVPLDTQAYGQYLESIKNPSMSRLAKKNFGIGVDNMQMLGGRALQFAGAEQAGANIVEQQKLDLAKTLPFQREFSDIGTVQNGNQRGAVDWFVANLAQQGPNLIESVLTAVAGGIAGTAASGPLASIPGALAAVAGKAEAKQAILAAAKKYAANQATDAEMKILRNAAGTFGAAAASLTQNYATGIADIYGEQRDQGATGEDANARLAAMFGAIPYAALESLPEFVLASRVLGGGKGVGSTWGTAPGATRLQRGAGYAGRALAGGVVGGTLEGTTETGQEALLMGLSGQDLSSPEAQKRLIESFAAGFGVGGPIGSIANLKRGPLGGDTGKAPTNLLQSDKNPEPTSTELTVIPPATEGAPTTEPANVGGMGARPDFVAGADGTVRRSRVGDRIFSGEVAPGQFGGAQGVLDLGGVPISELQQRSRQTGAPQVPQTPEQAAQVGPQDLRPNPNQGVLQFGPEAPVGVGFTNQMPIANPIMAQQMQLAQQRQQMEQAQQQREQQLAQQREAELNKLAIQAQNQRQLDLVNSINQQQAAQQQQPMPMQPVPVRQPQQLPLFTNKEAPRPSRAEGLRRGVGTQITNQPLTMPAPTPGQFQRAGQLSLFTQQGEPTVAALKSAGKPRAVTPTVQAGATQAAPTGAKVTPASTAAAKAESLKKRGSGTVTFDDGSSYTGQLKNGNPNGQGTMTYEDGSTYVGQFKDGVINGQGKFQDADGTVMEGKFINGEFQGEPVTTTQEKPNATQKGKQQQGRQPKRQEDNGRVQGGGQAGNQPTTQEQGGGAQASSGGKSLKRGQKQAKAQDVNAELASTLDSYNTFARKKADMIAKGKDTELVDSVLGTLAARIKSLGGVVPTEPTPPTPPKGGKALKKAPAKKTEAKGTTTKGTSLQRGPTGLAAMAGQLVALAEQAAVEGGKVKKKRTGPQETSEETKIANADLDLAIETIETTKNTEDYYEALFTIVEAYAMNSNARSLLLTKSGRWLREAIDGKDISQQTFVAALREVALSRVEITKRSRLYGLLAEHGLTEDADVKERIQVSGAKTEQEAVMGEPINTKRSPEQKLADLIANRDGYLRKDQLRRAALIAYAEVNNDNFVVGERGALKDFFDENGDPIIVQKPGTDKFVLATTAEEEVSTEEFAAKHAAERKALRELENEESQTTLDDLQYDPLLDNTRSDRGNLEFFRVDGRPMNPISAGALRLVVARAISKYAKKPKVAVFKNLADMKAKNPALFAAAAKARQAGDIEHVNAAGMAWGDNVVLFADNISTEQQARFIIAHETLGHVGFRGLFTDPELNRILQNIYDTDEQVRYAADVFAEAKGVPILEAVEEVMADRAAAVDTNTLLKLWNWVKTQLNKLGLKFRDDAARYLISLSRKYVRQGVGRSEVNLSGLYKEVAQSLAHETSDLEVLRFMQAAPQGSMTAMLGALNSNQTKGGLAGAFRQIYEANDKLGATKKKLSNAKIDAGNTIGNFLGGLQTMDNLARKSKGLASIFAKLQDKASLQTRLKTNYAEGTKTAHEASFMGFGEGPEDAQLERAGELLAYASLFKLNQRTDSELDKFDNPVFFDAELGEPKLNAEAYDALLSAGQMTAEDFRKGFKVQQGFVAKDMTDAERARLTAERDGQLADIELIRDRRMKKLDAKIAVAENPDEKARLELDKKEVEKKFATDTKNTKNAYDRRIKSDKYQAPNMVDAPAWFKELDENSIEFKMYNEFRETMAKSHIDVLISKYVGALYETERTVNQGIGRAFSKDLTAQERAFVEAVIAQHNEQRMEGAKLEGNRLKMDAQAEADAKEWLEKKFGRSFYNDLALGDLKSMVKGYTPQQVESIVKGMRAKLRNQTNPEYDNVNDNSIWALIRGIEEQTMFTSSLRDDQLYAKRSIAGAYTPLTREGDWQVRIQAYEIDDRGNEVPVKLAEGQQDSLPFYKVAQESEGLDYAAELNGMLSGEFQMFDEKGGLKPVFLRAEVAFTETTPSLVDILHYDDVMYSLSRLNVQLDVKQREALVKKVTAQNSRARSNLQRSGVPGWDKDVVKSSSAFLEQQAYVAANKQFRHQFDGILEDKRNWMGDENRLRELKAKMDAATGEAKEVATREYNQELYWYNNAFEVKNGVRTNRGNWYKERGKSLLDWMDSTGDIVHSDDPWTNNEWSVQTRTWAAVAQLGGSIATGISQMLSLPTNSWAYLASYNAKKGFGLGLGAANAGKLLSQAVWDVSRPSFSKLEYIQQQIDALSKSGDVRSKDGLTISELNFLKDLTEEQRLDAAQFNALTGTVRGKQGLMGNPTFQKFVQTWMTPFSYSEQFNRRVTVLAAYRGEYARQRAAGVQAGAADDAARKAAMLALDATQGDYAQYTRPAYFRGGVASFIYMYKQYPIMMVQLLKNMNYEGRIIMLGSLLLLSGLRGLPGADDLLDIVDGLCQRLGLKIGSVEKEFMRLTNSVLGDGIGQEVNQVLMRGLLDRMTGWSFSNRLGLGDIIPGTGLLKPSATKQELLREVENLAGAPTSFLFGVASYVGGTIPAVLTGRQGVGELLSDSPVRALKNIGDAWKYTNTGAILDAKGYVVAQNATAWEILGKAMGFYTSRAQLQQDWMAADSQEQAYATMIKTEAIRDAVAAKLAGDPDGVARAKQFVQQWNEDAKGTRLEIKNFDKSFNKAFQEAKQPLAVRALKSSGRGGRAEAKDLLRAYGVDEETLSGIPD